MTSKHAALLGKHHLGCNYWASNAGCFMWRQWDESAVRRDLAMLREQGLTTLRVFPLWPDFQPLRTHHSEFNVIVETRCDEAPPDSSLAGRACVDPIMLGRLERFCALAGEHGIELTVMLLTGWMSGRQFKPAPLEACNIYTDPFALKWQVRYVDCLVRSLVQFDHIIGWGLGNECNIMDQCPSPEAAYSWTALITKTIRAADPTRPILSGMHGLTVDGSGLGWRIEDQGELVDVMTVHPYAYFVKHCDLDPLCSIRCTLSPAAESDLYADLSGKPCMCEEIGDLGRSRLDEEMARVYLDTILWSNWANESVGTLWWCAFQQDHIEQTPYDWFEFEQDLGLFQGDRAAKPVVESYRQFQQMLAGLPDDLRQLPPRRRDAVCILTEGQDNWATALGTYILAKQAGFDLRFARWDRELPAASLYLLPSMCGVKPLPRQNWRALLQRVEQDGAALYLSVFDALLPDLARFAGLRVLHQGLQPAEQFLRFNDGATLALPTAVTCTLSHREGGRSLQSQPKMFVFESTGGEVLARGMDDHIMFARHRHGRGSVYVLNYGLEMVLAQQGGAFEIGAPDYARIYRDIGASLLDAVGLRKDPNHKWLTLTEHSRADGGRVYIGVNHSFQTQQATLRINADFQAPKVLYGDVELADDRVNVNLPPGKGFVILLSKV